MTQRAATRKSRLAMIAENRLDRAGLLTGVAELRFAPPRRFRFDYAYPDRKIAAEWDGGTWSKTRRMGHTTGSGFRSDCEKTNLATLLGWAVYRFTADMIEDGTMARVLSEALAGEKGNLCPTTVISIIQ